MKGWIELNGTTNILNIKISEIVSHLFEKDTLQITFYLKNKLEICGMLENYKKYEQIKKLIEETQS